MGKQVMLSDAAAKLGLAPWELHSLRRRGIVTEHIKVGRYYLYDESRLPAIRRALIEAGYIRPAEREAAHAAG